MDLKRKKIIAKEVLILSCVIAIVFVFYGVLIILEFNRKNHIKTLNIEKLKLKAQIDSAEQKGIDLSPFDEVMNNAQLYKGDKTSSNQSKELIILPKGFKLDKKISSNRPPLKLVGIEEARESLSKTIKTTDSLNLQLKLNENAIKSVFYFHKNKILVNISLILLVIVYPLRGLILLIGWSIKTVKE
jgi:hypothetical protein